MGEVVGCMVCWGVVCERVCESIYVCVWGGGGMKIKMVRCGGLYMCRGVEGVMCVCLFYTF